MEKTFTYQELQKYNGKGGNPAYISYKGIVYDVTGLDLWKTGRHQNLHGSGDDLTNDFARAPHGEDVLERATIIGKLVAG